VYSVKMTQTQTGREHRMAEITPQERKILAEVKAKAAKAKKKREADAKAGAVRYWDGRRDGHGGRMHL